MFAPSPFDAARGPSGVTDGPPPHATPRPAGSDTTALLGPQQDQSAGAMTPKARVLAMCAMLQQAANIAATDAPMLLQAFPDLVPMIQQISQVAPQMMDELARMPNPLSMFSAIGASALPSGPGPGAAPSPVLTNPSTAAGVPSRMPM